MSGAPADAMKERAGEKHRFDAHHVTKDLADLRPMTGAREEKGRRSGEEERACDVQPAAQERTYGRGR
jgi:hypothetical protein